MLPVSPVTASIRVFHVHSLVRAARSLVSRTGRPENRVSGKRGGTHGAAAAWDPCVTPATALGSFLGNGSADNLPTEFHTRCPILCLSGDYSEVRGGVGGMWGNVLSYSMLDVARLRSRTKADHHRSCRNAVVCNGSYTGIGRMCACGACNASTV